MNGFRELDISNTYVPNLDDIEESAERTLGEAESFYEKESLYLDLLEKLLEKGKLSKEDIYDKCHASASDLAKCCEMYLKALYIYEHNIPGKDIDEIWDELKKSDYQSDIYGNIMYKTSSGIITYPKYDIYKNIELDYNGKKIYTDDFGNIYNESSRGRKIKRNGHDLDRLIELLSPDTRLLLEVRMLYTPMEMTDENESVSIIDVLQRKGILNKEKSITPEQYKGWINQHRKTFEEARYSGQITSDVNVEFLFHLATQLRAVAKYKIKPEKNQNFSITEEEYERIPKEIKQLAKIRSSLISSELIIIVSNNEKVRNTLGQLLSNNISIPFDITSRDLIFMLCEFDITEISYISYICYIMKNIDMFKNKTMKSDAGKIDIDIARSLLDFGLDTSSTINTCIQLKYFFHCRLNRNIIKSTLDAISKVYDGKPISYSQIYDSLMDNMSSYSGGKMF